MTDIIDFALQPDSLDLAFTDGDIGIVRREYLVRQRLIIQHMTQQGSYDFDTTFGSPYSDVVFTKSPDIAQIEGMITELVVSTPNVIEIDNLQVDYKRAERGASVEYVAHTPFEADVRNKINPEPDIYMISILAGSKTIISR